MDFAWTDEQTALRASIIDFARARLNAGALERDAAGAFPRELWRELGQFGMLGLNAPREFGGGGHDVLTTAYALEALGYGCRDNGLAFGVSAQLTSIQATLIGFGNDAQKQRLLPGMVRGDVIGSYAMSEPETGSDAFALKTTALKRGDDYVLNGNKWFITFGPVADFALVFASTKPAAGKWGVSLFIVDRDTPGAAFGPMQHKLGLRSIPIGGLELRECVVPAANLIGREGSGASIFNSSQEWERACILASQIGALERQLEDAVQFARGRQAFGQSIGKFQSVSNRVADMKLRLETARLLTYKAAWSKQAGKAAMLDAALANLVVGEAFVASSMDAVRIHGARGFLSEFEIERDLRDAMGGPIYGGTADIQRNIIARLLGV